MKKILNRIFIEAMGGMTFGLFATLVIGTIIKQIGSYLPESISPLVITVGSIATGLLGAGIGAGVALKLKAPVLVLISAMVVGLIGGFSPSILSGAIIQEGALHLVGPGEPLGAFIGSYVAIELGLKISGKTKLDVVLTPLLCIGIGALVGLLVGPPISTVMLEIGHFINWATVQQPLIMGVIIAVVMGLIITGPLSSAAIAIVLQMGGLAAGAATIGCAAHMVGFAVSSFKENGLGGLVAQGIGTSMLQLPNVMKKPIVALPVVLTGAILAPIGIIFFNFANNPTGAGMGTAGLVGPLMAFQTMTETMSAPIVIAKIIVFLFIAPALLSWLITEIMRKKGLINDGDLKIDI